MLRPDDYLFGTNFDVKKALQNAIIDPNEEISDAETILSIQNGYTIRPILTRGNISTIIGKAKSRKTFYNTMVGAAIIRGSLYQKFVSKQGFKVVFFDTEQGRKRSQKVGHRIIELSGINERITVISMRPYSTTERIEIIEEYFLHNKVDFAIIDGIRDLVKDFNNITECTEILNHLLRWSEVYQNHISNVLHMNKTDFNARGTLGTELINKSETIIEIAKDGNYSTVKPVFMRDEDFDQFMFTIENGLPKTCQGENISNPNTWLESKKENCDF